MKRTRLFAFIFGLSTITACCISNAFALYIKGASDVGFEIRGATNYVSQGYYLTFASDGYLTTGSKAVCLNDTTTDGNLAQKTGVTIAANDVCKIYYYNGSRAEDTSTLGLTYTCPGTYGFGSFSSSAFTFATGKSGTYDFYLNSSNQLYINWASNETNTGYYVTYSNSSYSYNSGAKLDSDGNSNLGKKLNYEIAASKTIKIRYYNGGTDTYTDYNIGKSYNYWTNTTSGNSAIAINKKGVYNIYLGNDSKVYITYNIYFNYGQKSWWGDGTTYFVVYNGGNVEAQGTALGNGYYKYELDTNLYYGTLQVRRKYNNNYDNYTVGASISSMISQNYNYLRIKNSASTNDWGVDWGYYSGS